MTFADLQRRLTTAEQAQRQRAEAGSEAHRQRIAVGRFDAERRRAEAAGGLSPLKRARLGAQFSQRALSVLSGVSTRSIGRAERGETISLASLRHLARALECSVDDLA